MDAGRAKYNFGALSRVNAEAIGEPGERTFRLVLESGAASGCLWLEKEQLYQLATYIKEIVSTVSGSGKTTGGEVPEPRRSAEPSVVDFKVWSLSIAHDSSSNCLLLLAHDIQQTEESDATLSFWITLEQGDELAKESLKVCAAGRPRCFLCGQPINADGHTCPRANGHAPFQA